MAGKPGNGTLAAIVLILAAGTAFLGYTALEHRRGLGSGESDPGFKSALESIDRGIMLGVYPEAERMLLNLLREEHSAALYLQLSRRAFMISETTGNWTVLERCAEEGHRRFEGREDLAALLSYALLRSGRVDEALEISSSYKPFTGELMPLIHAEALLATETGSGKQLREYDPAALEELSAELESESLMADALLLRLVSGELDAAEKNAALLAEGICDTPYRYRDELLFQVYSDLGSYESALEIIDRTASLSETEKALLSADIMMKTGHTKGAADQYRAVILNHPDASWIPYLNLQFLELSQPENQPFRRLEQGFPFFKGNPDFLLSSALFCFEQGDHRKTAEFLDAYENAGGASAVAPLLRERIAPIVRPERYRSLLQDLLEEEGAGRQETGHAVWFFYGLRSAEELSRFASNAMERHEGTGWPRFTMALAELVEGNSDTALELFENAWELDSSLWEAAYDAALLHAAAGNSIEAAAWLRKAESSVPVTASNSRALIYARFAGIELESGDREEAERYIRYALEIAPDNPTARSFAAVLDDSEP